MYFYFGWEDEKGERLTVCFVPATNTVQDLHKNFSNVYITVGNL